MEGQIHGNSQYENTNALVSSVKISLIFFTTTGRAKKSSTKRRKSCQVWPQIAPHCCLDTGRSCN